MYAQIFFYDVGDESRWSGHKTVGIEPKKDNWHYIEIVQHSNIRKSQKSYRNAERKYTMSLVSFKPMTYPIIAYVLPSKMII